MRTSRTSDIFIFLSSAWPFVKATTHHWNESIICKELSSWVKSHSLLLITWGEEEKKKNDLISILQMHWIRKSNCKLHVCVFSPASSHRLKSCRFTADPKLLIGVNESVTACLSGHVHPVIDCWPGCQSAEINCSPQWGRPMNEWMNCKDAFKCSVIQKQLHCCQCVSVFLWCTES